MNFKDAAEVKFEESSRDDLVVFCDTLQVEYLPQNNAKSLRKKLLEALGVYHELIVGGEGLDSTTVLPQLPSVQQMDVDTLVALNLRSQGKWQGKRRRIVLHRALDYESIIFPQFFAWEGLHVYVPFGVVCDIPWTIWSILTQSNDGKKLYRRRKQDEEGRIHYEDEWLPTQRFMITDYGVTPDTEHLPEDIQHQMRMMWEATDGFDGYSENQFREICRLLRIAIPEEWKTQDMKMQIKRIIGLVAGSTLASPAARTKRKKAAA